MNEAAPHCRKDSWGFCCAPTKRFDVNEWSYYDNKTILYDPGSTSRNRSRQEKQSVTTFKIFR